MARRKSSEILGFDFWTNEDYFIHCPNLVKWNPRLAIKWFTQLSGRITSEHEENRYNEIAIRMNQFLDSLETMAYYRKEDYWDNDRIQRVPTIAPRVY